MSAEGDTNLDNDTAGDLICSTSDAVFDRILLLMRHPRGHEYDDQEIGELFFLIEVAFALRGNGLIGSSDSANEIPAEIEPYIERWAEYHRSAGGHTPPEARRLSMIETFDRLRAMISDFDSGPRWVEVKDGDDIPEESAEAFDLLKKIFGESD